MKTKSLSLTYSLWLIGLGLALGIISAYFYHAPASHHHDKNLDVPISFATIKTKMHATHAKNNKHLIWEQALRCQTSPELQEALMERALNDSHVSSLTTLYLAEKWGRIAPKSALLFINNLDDSDLYFFKSATISRVYHGWAQSAPENLAQHIEEQIVKGSKNLKGIRELINHWDTLDPKTARAWVIAQLKANSDTSDIAHALPAYLKTTQFTSYAELSNFLDLLGEPSTSLGNEFERALAQQLTRLSYDERK